MAGGGFEPSKAEPGDLQSPPIGRSGERVLFCEDVVTTGKSVKEAMEAVKPFSPKIVAVASLIDRSNTDKPFGDIRLVSLAKIDIKTYDPLNCPLCKQNIPFIKLGSRTK